MVNHGGVAVADDAVGARLELGEKGEILAAHVGRSGHHHLILAEQLAGDVGTLLGQRGIIDQHGTRRTFADFVADPEGLGLCRGDGLDLGEHQLTRFRFAGAGAQAQGRGLRNDVAGIARQEGADAHHGRILGRDVARDDGLQRHDQGSSRHHRVDAFLGHRAVAADTGQHDFPVVHRGEQRAGGEVHLALLQRGHVVHAEDRIHREALEQTVLDHGDRAAHDFFGGLEDQVDRAVERTSARQVLRSPQQHGAMTVMTAGMRLAFDGALVVAVIRLLHGEGVGIGTQADRLLAVAAAHPGHHARLADAFGDLVSPLPQQAGDVAGRLVLVERDLGVAVHVVTPGLHRFLIRRQLLQKRAHDDSRSKSETG